ACNGAKCSDAQRLLAPRFRVLSPGLPRIGAWALPAVGAAALDRGMPMPSALLATPAAEHPAVAGVAELAVSAVAEHADATGAAQFEKDFGGTAQHGPVGDDHDRLGGRGFDDVGDRGGDSATRLRP